MKHSLLKFLIVLMGISVQLYPLAQPLKAQNLVPNPRFEQISDCQQVLVSRTPIELAPPWFNPNGVRYDDVYQLVPKVCPSVAQWNSFLPYGFIETYATYQLGTGNMITNKAAYASAPLLQPLEAGKYYWFSMRAILTFGNNTGMQEESSYGLSLSADRPAYLTDKILPINPGNPQLIFNNRKTTERLTTGTGYTDNFAGRQIMQGCFRAEGNERYLTFGDFLHPNYTSRNSLIQFTDLSLTKMPDRIDLGPDISICAGQSLRLNPHLTQYAPTYRWQDGSTDSTLLVDHSGLYSLTVTCSCRTYSDTIRIEVRDPGLKAIADTSICEEKPLVLSVGTGFDRYRWTDGSTMPTITVNKPGIYSVEVERFNCVAHENIRVFSSGECCQLELPTAFTPNGDGLNDQFVIITSCSSSIQELELIIFNRWGEALFTAHNANTNWNGSYQGSRCEAGTYSWQLHYVLPHKKSVVHRYQQGVVMLIH